MHPNVVLCAAHLEIDAGSVKYSSMQKIFILHKSQISHSLNVIWDLIMVFIWLGAIREDLLAGHYLLALCLRVL